MVGGARVARLTALGLAAATAVVTLRVAWVGDDALITLRTLLNASHGWGWGFNITEAVQGYTHPLWFLLWLVLGSITGTWLLTVMVMGVVCTAAAVLVAFRGGSSGPRILAVGGVLLLSNAFVEYATSGLENSLGYLLFAAVIAITWAAGDAPGGTRTGVALGLLTAALLLTRLDYVLLLAPAAVVWVVAARGRPRTIAAAGLAAATPLALWFCWAWLTYGYLLPSTFEAKTNLALPRRELLATGWHYLSFSLLHDPATMVLLVVGGALVAAWGGLLGRAWLVGIAAYLGYVVWIGGDFMIGRFLAVPTFICAALVVRVRVPESVRVRLGRPDPQDAVGWRPWGTAVVPLAVVAVAGFLVGSPATVLAPPAAARWDYYAVVLSDERGVYADKFGTLGDYLPDRAADDGSPTAPPARAEMPSTPLWQLESAAAHWPTRAPGEQPAIVGVDVACGALGAISIMSGARVHVVDQCALTDRFLATLPGGDPQVVALPGHHRRTIPDDYPEAVRTGDPTRVRDPVLAQRLAEIWTRIRPAP